MTVLRFATGFDEADGIVRRIREAVDQNKRKCRDFAVFVRINALSRALETAFIRQRVPYQMCAAWRSSTVKRTGTSSPTSDCSLILRDNISFLRVVNEPVRGIGKVSLEHLRNYAEPREMSLLAAAAQVQNIPAIKGKAAGGLREFAAVIEQLGGYLDTPPEDVIRQVLDRSGYRRMLLTDDLQDQERLANIEELITATRQFTAEDPERTLADFLENITLASDVDGWDEEQDCVCVMTFHAAKGLEFPVVFMAATEQGLLPHERSRQDEKELEEEARLAFVGMTRAKEELYLCHAQQRDFRGSQRYAVPSQFLDELPSEGIEWLDLSASTREPDAGISTMARRQSRGGERLGRCRRAPKARGGKRRRTSQVRRGRDGPSRKIRPRPRFGGERLRVREKVKVRFSRHGDKTFIAEMAKLVVVRGG